MRAGRLRCLVGLAQKSVTRSETGAEVETWPVVATLHASISQVGGREVLAGERLVADVTHEIGLRYRPGITPAHRLVYQGRVFNVVRVEDVGERRREIRILVKEVVA